MNVPVFTSFVLMNILLFSFFSPIIKNTAVYNLLLLKSKGLSLLTSLGMILKIFNNQQDKAMEQSDRHGLQGWDRKLEGPTPALLPGLHP